MPRYFGIRRPRRIFYGIWNWGLIRKIFRIILMLGGRFEPGDWNSSENGTIEEYGACSAMKDKKRKPEKKKVVDRTPQRRI